MSYLPVLVFACFAPFTNRYVCSVRLQLRRHGRGRERSTRPTKKLEGADERLTSPFSASANDAVASRPSQASIQATSRLTSSIVQADDASQSEDYAPFQSSALLRTTLGLQHHHHAQYIGSATTFEPRLLGDTQEVKHKDRTAYSRNGTLRHVAPGTTFLIKQDQETQNHEHEIEALDAIEQVVAPHGPALVDIYFRIVHPSSQYCTRKSSWKSMLARIVSFLHLV